ncbi:MAG TPA: serine hydrolase domain-containing protein [Candidatus Elarobacter sp.]|jgi:CubicO group peptidase (beta-lactamase class C family)|nr:serine hydrolase domain-containing protein [Candidatus Elarobacter sp.]
MLSAAAFTELVHDIAQRRHIPGLSAAFERGGEQQRASHGVLNVETRVEATGDSIFQIGSVTKVFTGTLVMQLVDDGRVELDAPVRRYLPDLRIAGAPIDDAVTLRLLLAHAGGIVGDVFWDTGRNDDALAIFTERCSELSYLTKPGAYFSYCNSGYNLLGRVIEVVTGESWEPFLRRSLLEPLEIPAAVHPEETLRFRTAIGHTVDAEGEATITSTIYLPRSGDPAGSRLSMSASSLLKFARLHLQDGVAPNGTRLLSERSARAMRELVIALPVDIVGPTGYGLSWQVYDGWQPRAVGHDGATMGQSAFLRLVPEWDAAVSMLTNASSATTIDAFDELVRAVLASMGDTRIPVKPTAASSLSVDASRYAGAYETYMSRIVVSANGGETLDVAVSARNNESLGDVPDRRLVLRPVGDGRFLAEDPTGAATTSVVGFTEHGAGGKARFLFTGFRLAERVGD